MGGLRDESKVSSLPVHSADPDYPGYAINVTLDPRLDLPPHYEALGVVFVEVQQVPVVEPKMLIEFDVSLPLDPQMKGARRALQLAAKRDRAAAGREHAKDVRTRLNKFRDYLRLLDFKEADASNAEIGERLFPASPMLMCCAIRSNKSRRGAPLAAGSLAHRRFSPGKITRLTIFTGENSASRCFHLRLPPLNVLLLRELAPRCAVVRRTHYVVVGEAQRNRAVAHRAAA